MSSSTAHHRSRKLRLLRLLPNRWVRTVGPRRSKTLYLTFDDGPDPAHTPPLLDLLARHGVQATFFLVGALVEAHPDVARRIVREGHVLGNHSHTHNYFDRMSPEQQLSEVDRADNALAAIDGRARHPFRPPRGVASRAMLVRLIRHGTRLAYWSYDSLDYSKRPAPELAAQLRASPPRAGDIVLMHDDGPLAVALLDDMIPEWKARGFTFAAMPVAS